MNSLHIHVCVYTGHILEMEGTCAIFNWNDKKWDGVKVEDIAKRTQNEFNDF